MNSRMRTMVMGGGVLEHERASLREEQWIQCKEGRLWMTMVVATAAVVGWYFIRRPVRKMKVEQLWGGVEGREGMGTGSNRPTGRKRRKRVWGRRRDEISRGKGGSSDIQFRQAFCQRSSPASLHPLSSVVQDGENIDDPAAAQH